jgi:integrase
MKFLNDAEVTSLLNSLNKHKGERDSIMIRLTLFTGARSIETLRITKKDLKDGGVYIHAAKGSNDRVVPLPADFFKEVQDYAASKEDNDLLFPITTRRFRQIWDLYTPNSNLGLHSLRHTMGVRCYSKSLDIHATKTILGHVSMSSTYVYLSYVESQKTLQKTVKGLFTLKRSA